MLTSEGCVGVEIMEVQGQAGAALDEQQLVLLLFTILLFSPAIHLPGAPFCLCSGCFRCVRRPAYSGCRCGAGPRMHDSRCGALYPTWGGQFV